MWHDAPTEWPTDPDPTTRPEAGQGGVVMDDQTRKHFSTLGTAVGIALLVLLVLRIVEVI